MPNVGDVMGGGSDADFSWEVVYVGGVGMNGVGKGVFNYAYTVTKQGTVVGHGWVSGSSPDSALSVAQHAYGELARES